MLNRNKKDSSLDTGLNDELSFIILAVLVLAPMIILASSCSPKVEEFERKTPFVQNGPKLNDATITQFADSKKLQDKIMSMQNSDQWADQIESLYKIKTVLQAKPVGFLDIFKVDNTKLNLIIKKQENQFDKTFLTMPYDLKKSYYTDLVHSQIKDDVGQNLKDVEKKLARDTDLVIKTIKKQTDKYLLFDPNMPLSEKLTRASDFISSLMVEVKKLNILQEFKDVFLDQLQHESQTLLQWAIELDQKLQKTQNLSSALNDVQNFVKKAEFELSVEDRRSLDLGLELAKTLDVMNDAPTSLQALAIVWNLLEDEQRVSLIKTANKDLYEFFSDASEHEILCYTQKNCRGLKAKLVLNIGVYPKIEKFGFEQIKNMINEKSVEFVRQKVDQVSSTTLETIGQYVTEKTLKSVSEKRDDLKKFGKNLKQKLAEGLDKKISVSTERAVFPFVSTSASTWPSLSLQLQYMRNNLNKLETVTDPKEKLRLQLQIVEALAALPMYSKSPEKPDLTLKEEIPNLIAQPAPRQYLESPKSTQREVKIAHQAQMIRTMAEVLDRLADWKSTAFDQGLTQIKADEILTDFSSDQLKKDFFPRSELTAIAVSVSSQVLYLIQSEYSPLILVDANNQLVTMESFNSGRSGPIALVSATDFLNGHRVNTVRMKDMTQLLVAVNKMIDSLDGIDKTQSSALQQSNETGSTKIEELIQARQSLRRLSVGLANFISHQMRLPSGLVASSLSLHNQVIGNDYPQLLDQVYAIEALVKTYESTNIQIYLWSALDVYYALNQTLYSGKDGFYFRGRERKTPVSYSTQEVFSIYSSLLPLKKYLESSSQKQFERIMDPWLNAALQKMNLE